MVALALVSAACAEPEVGPAFEGSTGGAIGSSSSGEAIEAGSSSDDGGSTSGVTEASTGGIPESTDSSGAPEGCPSHRPVEIDGGCYVPVAPAGFHLIHQDFEASWDAIAELADTQPEVLITSQNRPPWLSPDRWAQRTSPSYHDSGTALAQFIDAVLSDPEKAPAVVLIDELRTEHIADIAEAAVVMRDQYPQWSGRWGVWLVHGLGVSYEALQPAVDELLLADARLVAELYPAVSQYCGSASNASGRDAWLTAYFRGGEGAFPQPRFKWLVDRRAALDSESLLSLAFGVTDTYLDRPGSAEFLDRMFYVWRQHSGFGSLVFADTGGVGAYKWHDHGPTTRDSDFVASYQHYAVEQSGASRLGPVPCN